MSLTPLSYQILLALADAPRHGYGIIKEIETREGSASTPSTGAIYLALQRLEGDRFIGAAKAPEPDADARRRYYELTPLGHEAVTSESLRLSRLVAAARAKNLLPEPSR